MPKCFRIFANANTNILLVFVRGLYPNCEISNSHGHVQQCVRLCRFHKPDKGPHVALVGGLQVLVVEVAVLLGDDDGRVPGLHQQQVHEQPRGSPVAIDEGMDVDKLVVRQSGIPAQRQGAFANYFI